MESIVSFTISAKRTQTRYDVQRWAKGKLRILTTIVRIGKFGGMLKEIYDSYGRISSTIVNVEKKLILVLNFDCLVLETDSRRCQSELRSPCSDEMKECQYRPCV